MESMSRPPVTGASLPQNQRLMSPPTRHRPSPKVSNREHSPWSRVVMDAPASPFLNGSSQHSSQPSPYLNSPPPRNLVPNDAFSSLAQPPSFYSGLQHQNGPTSPTALQQYNPTSPSPRNHLPWAHVVLQPNSPSTTSAPSQFSQAHLRPQYQDSPRASLEDLIATEPDGEEHIETCDEKDDDSHEDLDTLSISSSIYRGQMEHGRRYPKDSDYIAPSDEKQFESMAAGHVMYTILEYPRSNPFFRSPIPETGPQRVLDIGTGDGNWAVDVADRFPDFTIHAVDLYPPPQNWVPSNCLFEVDDMSKPWLWDRRFNLIHMRLMLGAFTSVGWDRVYREAWEHLEPGGWIEHVECDVDIKCEDGSLPATSQLATFGRLANDCADQFGCPLTIYHEMRERIERAGFVNIQEKVFKAPIGSWPRHPTYKDAGKCSLTQFKTGLSGWLLRLLTKYGNPEPWEPRKAQIYLAVVKAEIDAGHHIYQNQRRVWAQKLY